MIILGLILAAVIVLTAIGSARLQRQFPADASLVALRGVIVHFMDKGPRQDPLPLVFIHGASANLYDSLSAIGDLFQDRRVILLDRPGHGHSGRGGHHMSNPSRQADIVAALLDHLGIERAIIVGHSLGASITAAFAVAYPQRTAGLVFVAPATHPWPGGVAWYYSVATMPLIGPAFVWLVAFPVGLLSMKSASREVFVPDPMPQDYVDEARIPLVLRPANFIANARDVAALKGYVTTLSPRYREIQAPTAILTGDRDTIVLPNIHSKGLERDIAGSVLILAEGAGHRPHQSRRDLLAAAVNHVTAAALSGKEQDLGPSPAEASDS